MIEARQLCMSYARHRVVDGISFRVTPGEVTGFLGPNGAGKSTTMRMLTGAIRPRAGTALICGEDIRLHRRAAQALVGYLPEAADAFPDLTVGELLRFCGEARGLGRARLRERIAEICELTELTPALQTRLRELSKGWRQRAWFAQAIIHDPPVLVLDEPTDGLDPNQKLRIRDFIRSVGRVKTVLLSTHILEEAEAVCTRAIVIAGGSIVADAPMSDLTDEAGRFATAFHRLTAAAGESIRVGA